MANTINLAALDFASNKASFIAFLQSQSQFQDYNFAGSNINVLLDVLSYNTYQNAFLVNMAISEMFNDSAQLRSSIVSVAKNLNYIPRSVRSAVAILNLQFPQSGLSQFVIPQGTRFTGTGSNGALTFVTNNATILYPSGGYFTVNNFPVYEGSFVVDTFATNYAIQNQRYLLSNPSIDTNSLVVTLSQNGVNTLYTQAQNLFGLTNTSTVYFLQAANNQYELVFGDGVFGLPPQNGTVVSAQYRISSGTKGNGAGLFTLDDNLGSYNGYGSAIVPTITVVSPANNAFDQESIESIRFRAPRSYQTQDRAITNQDYKNLILANYLDIKTAHVFGGELISNTVAYGKVFIAPALYSGAPLAQSERDNISAFLADKCTLGITPVVVDPDYLYILVNTTVNYSLSQTSLGPNDISTLVNQAILNYNTQYLTDFNVSLKSSKLEAAIDATDPSIISNDTTIQLRKAISPVVNTVVYPTVNFRNSITPGSIISGSFISNGRTYIFTDYNPTTNAYQVVQMDGSVQIINTKPTLYLKDITTPGYSTYTAAGTIDYVNGVLSLSPITISGFVSTPGQIQFFAGPASQDIYTSQNDLLLIDPQSISINAVGS